MIIMLIPKIEPLDKNIIVGGSANSLLMLTKSIALNSKNHNIRIITSLPANKISLLKKSVPDYIHFTLFKNNSKPQTVKFGVLFFIKTFFWAFTTLFKKVTIVHGHSGYAIHSITTYFVSRISRSSSIHTIYCPIQNSATIDNKKKLVLKSGISLFFLRKMDKIIAMSQNIAHSLVLAGIDKKKITVLPVAIDANKFKPSNSSGFRMRKKLGIPTSSFTILYVGNLMRSKGLHILIEAFAKVARKIDNCKLIVTLELKHEDFDDRKTKLLKQLADLKISDQTLLLGAVDDMPALFAASDIFVTPYLDTQGPSDYPLAMMEAMSSGKCVVGTAVGGIPELISNYENGILVDPNDADKLANAIINIFSLNDKREQLGKEARKTIEENFNILKVAEEHLRLYSSVSDLK